MSKEAHALSDALFIWRSLLYRRFPHIDARALTQRHMNRVEFYYARFG